MSAAITVNQSATTSTASYLVLLKPPYTVWTWTSGAVHRCLAQVESLGPLGLHGLGLFCGILRLLSLNGSMENKAKACGSWLCC